MAFPVLEDMAEEVYHSEQRATKRTVSAEGKLSREDDCWLVAAVGSGLVALVVKTEESLPASSLLAPAASNDRLSGWAACEGRVEDEVKLRMALER